jgi:hypothetical protein
MSSSHRQVVAAVAAVLAAAGAAVAATAAAGAIAADGQKPAGHEGIVRADPNRWEEPPA